VRILPRIGQFFEKVSFGSSLAGPRAISLTVGEFKKNTIRLQAACGGPHQTDPQGARHGCGATSWTVLR
jgi:hypothetical protein